MAQRLQSISMPDLTRFRADFPILTRSVSGKPLVYMDSAATSLKPQPVIDAVVRFYEQCTSNVHRAVHALAEEATEAFEDARSTIAGFVHADAREIAFVRNTTEAVNLVAFNMRDRGAVAVAMSEHHSNLLPWREGETVMLPLKPDGDIDLEKSLEVIAAARPALVAMSTVNNALGTAAPVEELSRMAREVGAKILLDLSQSVGHAPCDLREIDCDFACFSGHKMLGPSGVGVFFCREECVDGLRPMLVGGSMIHEVHCDSYEPRPFPWLMEAGTPNIEGAFGLAAACDYLEGVGLEAIEAHGRGLTERAVALLRAIDRVTLHGAEGNCKHNIVSFHVDGMEAHGVARMLSNRFGIIVRSGYHCAQPMHEVCGLPESVRASFHLYNTAEEVDQLAEALSVVAKFA